LETLGQVTAAYFPELPFFGDTWKDPYLVATPREETEERAQGGRFSLERIAGSMFSAEYAFAVNRVEDELSGTSLGFLTQADQGLLNRDALFQRVTLDYTKPLSRNLILVPGVYYTQADADGDANSFDQYAARLQTIYKTGQHFVTTTITYSHQSGDSENPVFNSRQVDEQYSVFMLYSYQQPFGWKNWRLSGVGFWQQNDSSIAFFDESSLGAGIGIGYSWR
jgi:hypothetical protein